MDDSEYNLKLVAVFYLKCEESLEGQLPSYVQTLQERLQDFLTRTEIISGSTSVNHSGKDSCQIRIDVIRSIFDCGVPTLNDLILLDIHLQKAFRYYNIHSSDKENVILVEYKGLIFHRRGGH